MGNVHTNVNVIKFRPDIEANSKKGNPLTPEQQVCITLHHFGSQPFQRTTGLAFQCSQSTVNGTLVQVTDALLLHKPEWIRMPTYQVTLKIFLRELY